MIKSVRFALAAGVMAAAFGSASFAQDAGNAQVSANVLSQLHQNSALAADQLHVEAIGGTVYISGQVDNEIERQSAEQIARSVPQVDRVVNLLESGAVS